MAGLQRIPTDLLSQVTRCTTHSLMLAFQASASPIYCHNTSTHVLASTNALETVIGISVLRFNPRLDLKPFHPRWLVSFVIYGRECAPSRDTERDNAGIIYTTWIVPLPSDAGLPRLNLSWCRRRRQASLL